MGAVRSTPMRLFYDSAAGYTNIVCAVYLVNNLCPHDLVFEGLFGTAAKRKRLHFIVDGAAHFQECRLCVRVNGCQVRLDCV